MPDKEMVGVRLPADTIQRVERYADEHDLSKSDALRRMIEKGVDLEEAGLAVAASRQQEQTEEDEKKPVPDGGFLRLSDHPWIDPIVNTVDYTALFATISMIAAIVAILLVVPLAENVGVTGIAMIVGAFYGLAILGAVMFVIAVVGILILEYLMHPSEAPIRRYFYSIEADQEVVKA